MILVILAHFAVGVVAERTVCEPLQSPMDNQIFGLVDQLIPLDKILQVEAFDHHRGRHRRTQSQPISVSSVIAYVAQSVKTFCV